MCEIEIENKDTDLKVIAKFSDNPKLKAIWDLAEERKKQFLFQAVDAFAKHDEIEKMLLTAEADVSRATMWFELRKELVEQGLYTKEIHEKADGLRIDIENGTIVATKEVNPMEKLLETLKVMGAQAKEAQVDNDSKDKREQQLRMVH